MRWLWSVCGVAAVVAFGTHGARAAGDPLQNYYGNTVVCAASKSGIDLCHVWFYPNGKMIIFDQGGAHPAHYTVGPFRPTGTISVCMFWNDTDTVAPAEFAMPPMPPRPKSADGKQPARVCSNDNFRTTCKVYPDVNALTAPLKRLADMSMGQRWHEGMCYPYRTDVKAGDAWVEFDDPAPNQGNSDKVFLLPGHR